MPTITTRLDDYPDRNGLHPIILRIEHQGKRKRLPVGFKVQEKYWNDGRVINKHPDASVINAAIADKQAEVKRYLADCHIHGKPVRLDLIGTGQTSYSFTEYLIRRAAQYKAAGKIIMYQKVSRFAKELIECAGREAFFDEIDLDFLRRLEQYQIDQGNVENTRHKKFKFLSEFYAHAILEGKADGPNPFHTYKIAPKPVKKEKLTLADIEAIENLRLKPGALNNARNLFLFSYYAKGQRFETCVTLRRSQIRGGRIYFITNKGKDPISVKIHARLQAILDLYTGEDLVFPFLKEIPTDPAAYINAIASKNTILNHNLKIIARMAEIAIPLTFHIARHSFAYHLKKASRSTTVVQDALGHESEKTTQIYLKSLEDDELDGEMEKLYGV